MPLNAAERGMYIYQTFSPVAAIATSCLFGSCARGSGKLRHTRHRTQVRIRRNQTSETKFGTNCPKSEPNAVAYVSFLYTKQTTFRGWASLSIARQAGVSPPAHTGPGRTRRADDAHEKARVIPDQCGTRLPRRADGATRRRRPGASIPWAAAPRGPKGAPPCSREKNSWLPRAGTQ